MKHTSKAEARSLEAVWVECTLSNGTPTVTKKGGVESIVKDATGVLKLTLEKKYDGIAGVACAAQHATTDVNFNIHSSTDLSAKQLYIGTLTGTVLTSLFIPVKILVWLYKNE